MTNEPRSPNLSMPSPARSAEEACTGRLLHGFNAQPAGSEPSKARPDDLFSAMGEKSFVAPPLDKDLAFLVNTTKDAPVMPCLRCMSAGEVLIAMNVSTITHGHDPYDRDIILTEEARVDEGAWTGSGEVLFPGVRISRQAIAIRDVSGFTAPAATPTREIRRMDPGRFGQERDT